MDFTADDHALRRQVLTFYHETLKKSPEALGYLKQRGIESPKVIEHYQLGFANRTFGLRLPEEGRGRTAPRPLVADRCRGRVLGA